MSTIRTAQWGHWGISFSEHNVDANGRRSYAPTALHGSLYFPVGACGPCDLPRRAAYAAAVAAWCDQGTLPKGLQ